VSLALQIVEGEGLLKNVVLAYFRPTLQAVCDPVQLADLFSMPQILKDLIYYNKPIPCFKSLENLLEQIPVKYASYVDKNLHELPW